VGICVAISMQALAAPLLDGVAAADPLTFGGVSVVLLSVSLVASWLLPNGRHLLLTEPPRPVL
jgi:hypothetical protein